MEGASRACIREGDRSQKGLQGCVREGEYGRGVECVHRAREGRSKSRGCGVAQVERASGTCAGIERDRSELVMATGSHGFGDSNGVTKSADAGDRA